MTRLTLRVPRGFDFWRTVLSHGWAVLPPFACDREARTLHRVFRLRTGLLAAARMRATAAGVLIETGVGTRGQAGQRGAVQKTGAPGPAGAGPVALTPVERDDLRAQASTCLRLDEDLSEFHAAARGLARYRWIAVSGSGRLLRAPTLYEDVVKMICTTNCSWSLTESMVGKLVARFGEDAGGGHRAFPEPRALAESTERTLRSRCSMGYRAPYVLELSRRIASGDLDLEALRTSGAPVQELFDTLRSIKGVGPYAAGNLLKLLGRYDHLGLDSWVRGQYSKLYARGRTVRDASIERHYEPLGRWRGLFFWLEMTRSWHDEKFRRAGGDAPA